MCCAAEPVKGRVDLRSWLAHPPEALPAARPRPGSPSPEGRQPEPSAPDSPFASLAGGQAQQRGGVLVTWRAPGLIRGGGSPCCGALHATLPQVQPGPR